MNGVINSMLSTSVNASLQHVDSCTNEFFCGVMCGVVITLFAIAFVKLLYYIFV